MVHMSHHKDFFGGGEWSMFELLLKQNEKGNDVAYVGPPGALCDKLVDCGIKVFPAEAMYSFSEMNFRDKYKLLLSFRKLYKACRDLKWSLKAANPSILHVHSVFGYFLVLLTHMLSRPKYKLIYHHRSSTEIGCLTRLFSFADKIIVASQFMRSNLETYIDSKSIEVIPNAVSKINVIKRSREGHDITIVVPSVISELKGQETALDAFIRFAENCGLSDSVQIEFRGASSPENKQLIERMKSKVRGSGVEGCVSFNLFHHRRDELYGGSDYVIVPSFAESFGRVCVEAMSARIPVIVSEVGGMPEIVCDGQNGFLFPPGKVELLVEKMQKLIGNERLTQQFAANGYKTWEEKYHIDRLFSDVENVYVSILQS